MVVLTGMNALLVHVNIAGLEVLYPCVHEPQSTFSCWMPWLVKCITVSFGHITLKDHNFDHK